MYQEFFKYDLESGVIQDVLAVHESKVNEHQVLTSGNEANGPNGFTSLKPNCAIYLNVSPKFENGVWVEDVVAVKAVLKDHKERIKKQSKFISRLLKVLRYK